MTEPSFKKQGFKKCRSATFSIDGFSFTIVANETGESHARPLARLARESQIPSPRGSGSNIYRKLQNV